MSEFKPSRATAQKVAQKITTAAEVAGGRVINMTEDGDFKAGVFFSQEDWAKFIVLLLDDTFKP